MGYGWAVSGYGDCGVRHRDQMNDVAEHAPWTEPSVGWVLGNGCQTIGDVPGSIRAPLAANAEECPGASGDDVVALRCGNGRSRRTGASAKTFSHDASDRRAV